MKVRFAIIGYGQIGRRHAEEITAHPEAELVAIIDHDPQALEKAKEKYVLPLYLTIQDFLLSGTEADVACICTPNGLHVDHAVKALEGGLHVVVEKPIGLHAQACEAMLALANQNNRQVFPVLQNRFSPPARLLHSLIAERKLGNIFWVEVNCYWNRDERYYKPGGWRGTMKLDGGVLYTQFSHFVDILYWCFGPMTVQGAFFQNHSHRHNTEIEDTGSVHFHLQRGGNGIITYSTCAWDKNMESTLTVLGEKGSLKIGGQYMESLDYFHVEGMEKPTLEVAMLPNQYGGYQGSANHHEQVINEVIKALLGGTYDLPTAQEAIDSVRFIENAYEHRDVTAFSL